MEDREIARLAHKIAGDTKRQRGSKRYPWAALAAMAGAWLVANGYKADPAKAGEPAGPDDRALQAAAGLSGAQKRALREVAESGTTGAALSTVDALIRKGLLVQSSDPEEGFDLPDLGKAVCAILAEETD